MTSSLALPEHRYHVRSISLPSLSHPSAERIEEEFIKIRNLESSRSSLKAEVICNSLSSLRELYGGAEELLRLQATHQQFICQEHEKMVKEMLDGSVRLLDMCTITRDILLSMKEHAQSLQSTLRRRGGKLSLEKNIHSYMCFRKKVKKDAAKCIKTLKQMNARSSSSDLQDHHLSMVIGILRKVGAIAISIFKSILISVSAPRPKTRNTIVSLVSKVMHKGQVVCEEVHEGTDDVQSLDDKLKALCQHVSSKDEGQEAERVQSAQKGLKALEASIESIAAKLECLFRHLIQTRVSILNIITH